MAISYNTGSTGNHASTNQATGMTITVPAGVLTGDLMLVMCTIFVFSPITSPGISITPASGNTWTQQSSLQTSGANGGLIEYSALFSRIATGTDPSDTITFKLTGTEGGTDQMWLEADLVSYTGASGVDVAAGNGLVVNPSGGSGTTYACASTSTVTAGDWAVYFAGATANGNGTFTSGPGTQRQLFQTAGQYNYVADSNGSVGAAGTTIGGGNFLDSGTGTPQGWATTFVVGLTPAASAGGGVPPAQPGRSWLRRFHHPQLLLTQPASVAAPVYPLHGPVAPRWPGPFLKGRVTGASRGVYNQLGPPVTPLRGPVRIRTQLPPRGRTQGHAGTYGQLGPPVTPLRGPVRIRTALPARGRAQGRTGAFTAAAPSSGPPVTPLQGPVRARLPLQPLRTGRTATMVALALFYSGPPVYPLHGPVRTRPQPPLRGRCRGSAGTFTQVVVTSGAPVYPLRGPVRTRPQPPPRGRCAGNRGIRHQTGPPVTALRGPVAPFRPGPWRKGRCASSPGTYNSTGPKAYPLHGPITGRRPGPYLNGRCITTFIYRPPAPPPVFLVARSTATVADPRDGTPTVSAFATSSPTVADPRDGTPGVS